MNTEESSMRGIINTIRRDPNKPTRPELTEIRELGATAEELGHYKRGRALGLRHSELRFAVAHYDIESVIASRVRERYVSLTNRMISAGGCTELAPAHTGLSYHGGSQS
jgi:hypothetical protein